MKRHVFNASLVTIGLNGILASAVLAVPHLDATNHAQWDEGQYINTFGGAIPVGAVESYTSSGGFAVTLCDYDGRVLSNAGVTTNTTDSTVLTTISTGLFSIEDANLYQFQVTNPSTFSASVASTNLVLALFNSSGGALAASIGGATDAITGANAGITTPGIYYIGIADPTDYPQNAEDQNIFGLSGTAGVFTPVTSDKTLSSDPYNAWTNPGGSSGYLLANTDFTAGSSTITLAGSNFAAVPEPTTIGLLGTLSLGLLARRRKS